MSKSSLHMRQAVLLLNIVNTSCVFIEKTVAIKCTSKNHANNCIAQTVFSSCNHFSCLKTIMEAEKDYLHISQAYMKQLLCSFLNPMAMVSAIGICLVIVTKNKTTTISNKHGTSSYSITRHWYSIPIVYSCIPSR